MTRRLSLYLYANQKGRISLLCQYETHLSIGRGRDAACHAPVCVTETENLLLPIDVVETIAVG